MHPDAPVEAPITQAESLRQFMPVTPVADTAQEPVQRVRYEQQIGQQVVSEAHGRRVAQSALAAEPIDHPRG